MLATLVSLVNEPVHDTQSSTHTHLTHYSLTPTHIFPLSTRRFPNSLRISSADRRSLGFGGVRLISPILSFAAPSVRGRGAGAATTGGGGEVVG